MSQRTIRLIAVVAAVLPLLFASNAVARIPKFKPLTIVPGKSIGGVQVGMKKAAAAAIWGKPDRCDSKYRPGIIWCQYLAKSNTPGGATVPQPFAGFFLRSGKVVAVELEFAENTGIDPKLKRLKTSKGIHLGSKMAAARSAYNIGPPSGGEAGLSRAMFKQGARCTMFYAPNSPYTSIDAIQVGLCSAGAGLF